MKQIFWITSLAIVLSGCVPSEPSPASAPRSTVSRPAITAALAPTSTIPTASAPTTLAPLALYDDRAAPFTIQYPRDWRIREEPESIFFTAPGEAAAMQIITYEYQEGAPKNITAKDVLNNFTQNFSLGTGLRLTQQVTNADASISANVEFTDAARVPQQGLARVILAKNRRYHFIILFAAPQNQFARYKSIGTSLVEGFRER